MCSVCAACVYARVCVYVGVCMHGTGSVCVNVRLVEHAFMWGCVSMQTCACGCVCVWYVQILCVCACTLG